MDTKRVVESLLHFSENPHHLKQALRLGRVINGTDRDWYAKDHPELRPHLQVFRRPHVLVTIGLLVTVFVLAPGPGRRIHAVIIRGKECDIADISRTKLIKDAVSSLSVQDYMPDSGLRQIIWIPHQTQIHHNTTAEDIELRVLQNRPYEEPGISGVVFTEGVRGQWFIDPDVSRPDPQHLTRTNAREILKHIAKEVKP